MKRHDGQASRNRRNFLKAAGVAAVAFATAKGTLAQNENSKSAPQKDRGRTAPPDRGIWITWYDLPMEGRDAYFSWLHGTYLPGLLKRPGYLWAAHYASQDLEGGAENATRYKHVDDPRPRAKFDQRGVAGSGEENARYADGRAHEPFYRGLQARRPRPCRL
jgi:hypothetical protein